MQPSRRPPAWAAAVALVAGSLACGDRDPTTATDRREADALAQSAVVPAAAPNSAPASLLDPASVITGGSRRPGHFVRGLALVLFAEGATQAERQAAVDSVSGTVVGGRRSFGDDGFYYVRVSDDTTIVPVLDALRKLRTLPQVEAAFPAELAGLKPSYLRPTDGDGWSKADWEIRPDSASGVNWALEAIAAPLAWGCSTGGPEARVAVVDEALDIRNIPDLTNQAPYINTNLALANRPGLNDHGTLTASVLAAAGNDATGMTGVLWRANLALYDRFADPYRPGEEFPAIITYQPYQQGLVTSIWDALIAEHLYVAGMNGADVINVSFNQGWISPAQERITPNYTNVDHIEAILEKKAIITSAIRRLRGEQKYPLIVVSAGNDDVNAYFGGTTLAKEDFPDQVLVVGGSDSVRASGANRALTRARFNDSVASNYGDLVDLYAPGKHLTGARRTGTLPSNVFGTSFAAPLVAGVAGLLKAFDPSIPNTQLKALILRGAQNGGRTVEGKPFLNAYEALREAARRPGAPLCGNRVWAAGGQVVVERKDGDSEVLASGLGGGFLGDVIPLHGGQRIFLWRMQMGVDEEYFLLEHRHGQGWGAPVNVSAWYRDSIDALSAATTSINSMYETSHDGDASMSVSFGVDNWEEPTRGFVNVSVRSDTTDWYDLTTFDVPDFAGMSSAGAYPTVGDVAYVAFTQDEGTNVYRVSLRTGGRELVGQLTGRRVRWLGMAESGDELVLGVGDMPYVDLGDYTYTHANCRIEYRSLDLATVHRTVAAPDACYMSYGTKYMGAGNVAPKVAGRRGTRP